MKYRRINPDSDYVFGGGINDFKKDKEAFAQACKSKLKLYFGEWWEDLAKGLPLYEEILGRGINSSEEIGIINQLYLETITQIQGFVDFQSVSSNFDKEKRKYSLQTQVNTKWGQTAQLELI